MEKFGAKGLAEECDRVILLSENSPHAHTRSACFNKKWLGEVRQPQNWSSVNGIFENFDGQLGLWQPLELILH